MVDLEIMFPIFNERFYFISQIPSADYNGTKLLDSVNEPRAVIGMTPVVLFPGKVHFFCDASRETLKLKIFSDNNIYKTRNMTVLQGENVLRILPGLN